MSVVLPTPALEIDDAGDDGHTGILLARRRAMRPVNTGARIIQAPSATSKGPFAASPDAHRQSLRPYESGRRARSVILACGAIGVRLCGPPHLPTHARIWSEEDHAARDLCGAWCGRGSPGDERAGLLRDDALFKGISADSASGPGAREPSPPAGAGSPHLRVGASAPRGGGDGGGAGRSRRRRARAAR